MAEERPVREMAVPARALVTLRRSLRSEVGPLTTVHLLHEAGYEAGLALADVFLASLGDDPEEVSEETFWRHLSDFLARRGWGSVSQRTAHPAVGLLASQDWAEAGHCQDETQPCCAFSSGMFAGVLGRAAGGPIAVLELSCMARGEDACVFAYGSETAIHQIYGELLEGADLESALSQL